MGMSLNKDALNKEYSELRPKYEKLGEILKTSLTEALKQAQVNIFNISYRIKDFDSFWDKVSRNNYQDPFSDCRDVCGLRIITYYKSDVEKTIEILEKETQVLERNIDITHPTRNHTDFRAQQIIITLNASWLSKPELSDLRDLKAEIEIRTIIIDTLSQIAQKLSYENRNLIPEEFQRQFDQICNFLDLADITLDELHLDQIRHSENIAQEAKRTGEFDRNLNMNLDHLQAFLDFYFPDRKKNLKHISWLLINIIMENKISMRELVEAYEKVKIFLPSMEKELSELLKERYFFKESEFERTQSIMLMTILSLTNDDYWKIIGNLFDERYWEPLLEFFLRWRQNVIRQARDK